MPSPSSPKLRDYLDSSSLDPLATLISPKNVDAQTAAQPSSVRLPSSPTKTMRVVEDVSVSSPHRQYRRRSNAPNSSSRKLSCQNLSPWRIRVTVEAEPEEMGIPNGRTTIRTMKVPLREESPSVDLVDDRGRRSQSGSCGTKRRSTPVRGARASSKSRRPSVTDLSITVLGDEEDCNAWSPKKPKRKGRSRNKKSKQEQRKHAVSDNALNGAVDDGSAVEEGGDPLENPAFAIRPDSDAEDHALCGEDREENSPGLRKIDLNRVSVHSRGRPPKGRKSWHKKDEGTTSPTAIQPPALALDTKKANSRTTTNVYPTPTSSIQDDSDDAQNSGHHEELDTILESEGFTMIDLESISSARYFISPPSDQVREKAGQVETRPNTTNDDTSHSSPLPPTKSAPSSSPIGQGQLGLRPEAIPAHVALPEAESDLSSTVPSSPPVLDQAISTSTSDSLRPQKRVTPVPYSSPRLPSPPRASVAPLRPRITQAPKSTPKLSRVVKAGIALQGVLSPQTLSQKSRSRSPQLTQGTPKERLDDLFQGFDPGTRRELRAGLRFGEELAKRLKSNSPVETEKKAARLSPSTYVWRGETTVQQAPIPLLANTNDMLEKGDFPASTMSSVEAKRAKVVDAVLHAGITTPVQATNQVPASTYLNTQAKEREWQLEREAVSRQIQNANTSQVIVIGSDGIDESSGRSNTSRQPSQCTQEHDPDDKGIDETDGDIWLAEAEARNSPPLHTEGPSLDMFPPSEQERQRKRAREVVSKPRRSLIPSPWKRGEDVDGASTFTSNSDISGLLWKQPRSNARFGAGAINRQMQGKNDAFGSASSAQDTPLRLRQDCDNAERLPISADSKSSSATDKPAEERLSDQGTRTDEIFQEDECNGADDDDNDDYETADRLDESICKSGTQQQAYREEECSDDGDMSTRQSFPQTPEPIKIPVNFNDSTNSAAPLTPSAQANTSQISRPSTPRSALKGSRMSLGLEDTGEKKVVFSSQSYCVDEDGQKSNSRIKSPSPTPPPSNAPYVVDLLQPALSPPKPSREISEPELEVQPEAPKSSWLGLGWLFGSKPSSAVPTRNPAPAAAIACTAITNVDGLSDGTESAWYETKSSIVSSQKHDIKVLPSFLCPPSYPSDPSRDVSIPLATSGEFTDMHFRTLHIIYRKSLRRSFHAPDTVRPTLQKIVGERFSCDEGEYGHFAWEVDQDAVVVVERFMLEVELGWVGKGNVKWVWSEKELCGRLFRIIVGEEVRREQSWRREEQKKIMAVSATA